MRKNRVFYKVCLVLTAILIMQIPVSEADAASSASDFQMEENNPVKTAGTEENEISSQPSEVPVQREAEEGNVIGSTTVVGNRAVIFMDHTSQSVITGIPPAVPVSPESTQASGGSASGLQEMAESLPKYRIVDSMTVADQAYYGEKSLVTVSLPEGIAEIGEFSFARSGLQEAAVPAGVTDIRFGAFYHCDSLQKVELPETVMRVEPEAFRHTPWVKQFLENGTSDYLLSGGVLAAYRGSGDKILIPEGTRVIAAGVFAGHGEIKSVTLPDSLQVIGEGAFENCENLRELSGGPQVVRILDRAFAGCPIDNIQIAETVQEIGLGAFDLAKTVVFEGKILPRAGYENSSGRLSNESYRKGAFGDALIAVVDESLTEAEIINTVLCPQITDFRGVIGSVLEDKKFHCRYTPLKESEWSSLVIPEEIQYKGIGRQVTDQRKITELDREERIPEGTEPVPGTIMTTGEASGVQVSLDEGQGSYVVHLENGDKQELDKAYQRSLHLPLPPNAEVIQITMRDMQTAVPITRLGRLKLTITMPVPRQFINTEIQLVTLDRNGQLEYLPVQTSQINGISSMTFSASQLWIFGVIGANGVYGEAQVSDKEAVITEWK